MYLKKWVWVDWKVILAEHWRRWTGIFRFTERVASGRDHREWGRYLAGQTRFSLEYHACIGREGFPENRINLCFGASYWAGVFKRIAHVAQGYCYLHKPLCASVIHFFGRIYIRLVQMITARVMIETTMIPVRRQFLQTLPKVFNVITDSPD